MRNPLKPILTLALLSTPLVGVSCATPGSGDAPASGVHESEAGGMAARNGLTSINGLSSVNGLTSVNGLSSVNGLTSINGLSPTGSLMSSDPGRTTVSYIVRCALPAGHSISKVVNGATYSFTGELGLAPDWETGACSKDCQEAVSACVLSHVNTSGQHIGLWLDSADPALGWGQSTSYPYQEGSFFGNIFVSPPQAFYCNGKDWDQGLVPGRLGVGQNNAPYKNPSSSTYCKDYCAAADGSASGDGYKSCGSYKHVVTVWRNFDPSTQYKVCARNGGKCLDVQGASTDNSATVVQYGYKATANQKWMITQVSPLNYKFTNVNSGKALDISGGWTGDGASLIQYDYHSGSNQLWNFTPTGDGYYKFSPGSNSNGSITIPAGTPVDGVAVQQMSWTGAVNQQWVITPAN